MTTNTSPAMDRCKYCTVRGDMDGCRATPCNVRTSWFTQETESTHLRELAAYRLTVENLEREIAAQQPAPSPAPATQQEALFDEHGFHVWVMRNLPDDTIIGSSAYWADHLTAWAKRFVKAAPTAQADTQPSHQWDVGYPPLPEQLSFDALAYAPGCAYSEAQMRAYVDSDRAARAPADSVTAPAGGIPGNFITHRASWREALETVKAHAAGDDVSYWDHELRAFDRSFDRLWALMQDTNPPAQAADSVLEDAARLDWLDQQCEGYGFQDIHEGNRWEISGPYANVRQAIDATRAGQKEGEKP